MKKLFGIIGLGNIGKVHTRIFSQLGCELSAVLLNRKASLSNASEYLQHQLDRPPKITSEINEFFSQDLDFVVLASPIGTHFDYLVRCFNLNLPVFCEKPLLWDRSPTKFKQKIKKIKSYNGKFLVNTANTVLIHEIKKRFALENIGKFCFSFHTRGKHRGSAIAVDLLPHATALLTAAFGYGRKINNLKSYISENTYKVSFEYFGKQIAFDFIESSSVQKKMTLAFDDKIFERQVSGIAEAYKVSLTDRGGDLSFEIDDPFMIYAKKFLRQELQTSIDLHNLNLNADILFNE